VFFFGFVLTNRIAGPIYRLKQHLEDVAAGKTYEDIGFRKMDYFSELIEPYNKILAELRELKRKGPTNT